MSFLDKQNGLTPMLRIYVTFLTEKSHSDSVAEMPKHFFILNGLYTTTKMKTGWPEVLVKKCPIFLKVAQKVTKPKYL